MEPKTHGIDIQIAMSLSFQHENLQNSFLWKMFTQLKLPLMRYDVISTVSEGFSSGRTNATHSLTTFTVNIWMLNSDESVKTLWSTMYNKVTPVTMQGHT